MAWIYGSVSESEATVLRRRGWELQPPSTIGLKDDGDGNVVIYVDNDVLALLDSDECDKGSAARGSPVMSALWRGEVRDNKTQLDFEDWYEERQQRRAKQDGATKAETEKVHGTVTST